MPSKKAPAIEALITKMAGGLSRDHAAQLKICVWCKRPLGKFRNELSRREYHVSGLCQTCQNEAFAE